MTMAGEPLAPDHFYYSMLRMRLKHAAVIKTAFAVNDLHAVAGLHPEYFLRSDASRFPAERGLLLYLERRT